MPQISRPSGRLQFGKDRIQDAVHPVADRVLPVKDSCGKEYYSGSGGRGRQEGVID